MYLTWDPATRALNRQLHGEDFADIEIFDWLRADATPIPHDGTWQRQMAIAALFERVNLFVFERNGDRMKLVRMRRADPLERRKFDLRTRFTHRPTEDEERDLLLAIDSDPPSAGPSPAMLASMHPAPQVLPADFFRFMEDLRRERAHHRQLSTKKQITLRLDADILDSFRAEGDGWQKRINETLRRARGL